MLSLAFSRTLLSLSALSITDTPSSSGFWLPEDAMGRPGKEWDKQYADKGLYHGRLLVGATLEQATLPVRIYARSTTTSGLETLQASLEAALGQFTYTATVTIDGAAKVWTCDPGDVQWADLDSGMVAAKMAVASVSIPVYPIAGT